MLSVAIAPTNPLGFAVNKREPVLAMNFPAPKSLCMPISRIPELFNVPPLKVTSLLKVAEHVVEIDIPLVLFNVKLPVEPPISAVPTTPSPICHGPISAVLLIVEAPIDTMPFLNSLVLAPIQAIEVPFNWNSPFITVASAPPTFPEPILVIRNNGTTATATSGK